MQMHVSHPVLALEAGEVVTLDDALGTRIRSRQGTVWVTQEGSRLDHIVGPGDAFVVGRRGRIVVQALRPSWISIDGRVEAANDSH
ncbi:MAG TPA: DUF2917 domain-containing protein [Usitatibacter sp.]|nr:DUF2917 domain-containing protein [Usitatibacter sp.]